MFDFITKRKGVKAKREALAKKLMESMRDNILYTVTYVNSDGTDLFTRNFTQAQIDNDMHLFEISHSICLRDYKVLKIEKKDRKDEK